MISQLKRYLNRWRMAKLLRQKREPFNFVVRMNVACISFWQKFHSMPRSKFALDWAERNHARLIKVSQAARSQIDKRTE